MRVFITGAAGFIGKALVKELLDNGHQVLGLARSEKNVEALTALGADVIKGDLHDLESLKKGAAETDGVIHLAFIFDFQNFDGVCQTDRDAIEAMAGVLAGSDRPLITTSGALLLRPGLGTEDDTYNPEQPLAVARGRSEELTKSLASKGIRSIVMRLPPTNHGPGDKGFVPFLIQTAREKGYAAYVGDGLNRWPAVHVLDTAHAYRLALEKGRAGSVLHPAAEEGVALKDVGEAIGRQLKVPVRRLQGAEAEEYFSWLHWAMVANNPVSTKKTKEQLGWEPKECSLITDIETGGYIKS